MAKIVLSALSLIALSNADVLNPNLDGPLTTGTLGTFDGVGGLSSLISGGSSVL